MSKNVPAVAGSRPISLSSNGQALIPVLPRDVTTTGTHRDLLRSELGIVALMEAVWGGIAAYEATRTIIYDPQATREAHEEARKDVLHAREIAEIRRQAQKAEEQLIVLKAKHALEAEGEFKEHKFESGRAGFKRRQAEIRAAEAEARLKESIAREDEEPDIIVPERKPDAMTSDLAQHFARLVDDLEVQIDKAEARGQPTEQMRSEQDVLNKMLRRELLKGKS